MKEKKEKLFVVNRCCMGLWDGPGTGPGKARLHGKLSKE